MKPTSATRATLVDLLDRVLDKGLVLNLDLLVCVSGIPLLGVNLRAALAGMETMLEYGVMADWDEVQRAAAASAPRADSVELEEGEEVLSRVFATVWRDTGVYRAWEPGWLHVTDRRLLLADGQGKCKEQVPYGAIREVALRRRTNAGGRATADLVLALEGGREVRFHPRQGAEEIAALCRERLRPGSGGRSVEPRRDRELLFERAVMLREGGNGGERVPAHAHHA